MGQWAWFVLPDHPCRMASMFGLKGRFGIEGGTGSLLISELTATVR